MLFRSVVALILGSGMLSAQALHELAEARLQLEHGDAAAAERTIRAYLTINKHSADGYFLLGYTLFKRQEPRESLAAYTEGAKFRKPNALDLEAVGCDYVLLKDYEDADKWLTQSVAEDPSNLSALYYLGRTKYNENRFEEAVSTFLRCLHLDPMNVKYADNLGLSYQGLGRNEEAEAMYRSAIDWDRVSLVHNFGPYLDLGVLLVDTGRPIDALPLLQRAVQLSPKDLRVRTQLGKAYLHAGQLEKAQAQLEAAVQLEPRNAPTHFMLAQIYRKRGMLEKARRESKTYSALNQDHSSDKETE